MREVFLQVITLLVGNYNLADIWAGFIASAMASIIYLRSLYGGFFYKKIHLGDIFVWMIGIFICMRFGMFLIPLLNIPYLIDNKDVDSVFLGVLSGIINVYLFKNNYKSISSKIDKFFNNIFGKANSQ